MILWIWLHVVVATLLAVSWSGWEVDGQSHSTNLVRLDEINGICQRKYIRNEPSDLEKLSNCEVIEGSLQIALVNSNSSEEWSRYKYPRLREITGYLLIFEATNLTTLTDIFPNLAVIRGQELVDTHSLIISNENELQEIGLRSLTDIQRGSVWIVDNPRLCYVDTIDWTVITHEYMNNDGIAKNKPSDQCPNICQDNCPKSDLDDRRLCWSSRDCQKVYKKECPLCLDRQCSESGECCNKQCLGGCTGPNPWECHVCKHVVFNKTCTEECPPGYYEYFQRRCVTRDNCLKMTSLADVSKYPPGSPTELQGKVYEENGKKMCVLECPKGTELAPNKTDCVQCTTCKKVCPGTLVDSVEKARELAGCTRIQGVLKISIRRSSSFTTGHIVKELKQNLDKIEEIDHHLVITHTHAIVSLDFLENLKIIRGWELEDKKYALVVRSNENLMEMWDSRPNRKKVIVENKEAIVLFHYNPKLCPRKIWDFVAQAGIEKQKDNKIDIGITNGDKVSCNTQILDVEIEKKMNNSVLIRYENFRRNLTLTSHLLNYEIHYKEAPEFPIKNVSKYDDRDPCGDDDWTILEYPKISDTEVRGGITKEPQWEYSRLIVNLKHFAYYALYVKAVVIPDENALNKNMGAESDIIYFQTLPGIPSKPQEFILSAGGPNTVSLTWTVPEHPNGDLEKFIVWLQPVKEDQRQQDERDYCTVGRTNGKNSKSSAKSTVAPLFHGEGVTLSTKPNDPECCTCSSGKTTPPSFASIEYQDSMMNEIMNRVFLPKPPEESKITSSDFSQDIDSNHVRVRKRSIRKRSAEDSNDNNSSEKLGEIFPGEESSPGMDQPRVPKGMEKWKEVNVTSGLLKYTVHLKNLTHFTTYVVGIQACRRHIHLNTNATEIENDTRTCSEVEKNRIQTAPTPAADLIDPRTIITNITDGNRLHISWAEPTNPNGVIMAYMVEVQRLEGSKHDSPIPKCVTRKDFQLKRNWTFPVALQAGNYSARIQVQSLARDSEWTEARYFLIEDSETGLNGLWVLVILLPLLLMIIIGSLLAYYYIRTKGIIDGRRIFSANPEYMSNVDIPDEWEVPRDKIELLKDPKTGKINELGQGSFGTVLEGMLKDFISGASLIRCAVKTVSEDTCSEDRALFLREAALMVKLDCHCHHVVKLLGVISKTQPTYVIMELMAKGDLKNYLRSRRPGSYNNGEPPPTLRQILRMAAEISDGMAYIHKHKLVHRDLAARNCMVGEPLVVKVGDFGMTKEVIQSDYYRKQTKGLLPVRWMAPESLHDGVFTNQTDVWSFGVVLWEMATLAAQPYQGLSNSQVLEYVQSGRTMERPENCPDILYDLMTMCWRVDSRRRPSFIEILERLGPDLEDSFAQVSFYHSTEGLNHRAQSRLQCTEEELITIRTPLRATFDAMSDDELDDYETDDDPNDLNHHIVDDLGDTPNRLLLSTPPSSVTITGSSRTAPSLTNGLALNPLNIQSSRTDSSTENINLANHALPGPTSASANPYSRGNYSPRPRTNSNNNNTNPRLPVPINFQNSSACSNVNPSGPLAGSSSSLSSTTYTSQIPNGVDSVVSNSFHPSTSSPKCSVNTGDSKVEQSKANALNTSSSSDNSQALMINYSGDGSKISNGNGGNGGGNGYIIRRNSPNENQSVNRTTQC